MKSPDVVMDTLECCVYPEDDVWTDSQASPAGRTGELSVPRAWTLIQLFLSWTTAQVYVCCEQRTSSFNVLSAPVTGESGGDETSLCVCEKPACVLPEFFLTFQVLPHTVGLLQSHSVKTVCH